MKNRYEISDDKIPSDIARHSYIFEKFNLNPSLSQQESMKVLEFEFKDQSFYESLSSELLDKLHEYGFIGFQNLYSEVDERFQFYGGLGVTYNVDYKYQMIPPMAQVLGSPRKNLSNFFSMAEANGIYEKLLASKNEKVFFYEFLNGKDVCWEKVDSTLTKREVDCLNRFKIEDQVFSIKNSYSDSWGFNCYTKVAKNGRLNQFLNSVEISLVRSRLAVLKQDHASEELKNKLWHRDECPYKELRLIIPINVGNDVTLEINYNEVIKEVPLQRGKAYFWDTQFPHRVLQKGKCPQRTINLVLGFSPWFSIDSVRKLIKSSHFFDKNIIKLMKNDTLFPMLEYTNDL